MAYTWKKQASSAYGLSLTQLVLNAVMFAEELPEPVSYTHLGGMEVMVPKHK